MQSSERIESIPNVRRKLGRPSKVPSVKQHIRSRIISGEFKANDKIPTLEAVASQLGVAMVTAKRAVDELVREGWLVSKQGVGTFVRIEKSGSKILLTAPAGFGSEPFFSSDHLEAFHRLHPNVRITLTTESPTDIAVMTSYSLVVDRFRDHHLLSLDELRRILGRPVWQLPEAMRKLGSWQGSMFGLPMRADLLLMQVNRRLMENTGVKITHPFLDWRGFTEIMDRCHADRNGDGFAECAGAFSKFALYEWLIPFWQRGGRLDNREAFFRPEALRILDELWEMHHVTRTYPVEFAPGQGRVINKVLARRFEMGQVSLRWIPSVHAFGRPPFPVAFLLPRFGSLPRQMVQTILIGIHRDCSHPEVAMEFLDFCYRRFILGNQEYPFALTDGQRLCLRQSPEVHRLLEEGLSHASEPLQEGIPPRTWAIEQEINDWFRLLQDRTSLHAKLKGHWERWSSQTPSTAAGEREWMMSDAEFAGPVGPVMDGE